MACQLIESGEEYVDRSFQEIVAGFLDSKKNILVLQAPTGAGKTRAFSRLYSDVYRSFIVMPNNVLIDQNFREFSASMTGVERITASSVRENAVKWNLGREYTITKMVSNSTLVFTNPTLLLFILTNFYRPPRSRSDHISHLVIEGLRCIVLDEFHVYSRDQKYRLLALISLLRRKIKFLISSATLEEEVVSVLRGLVGDDEIEIVNVEKAGSDFIRGPIGYDLHPEGALDTIKQHLDDIREGKWFLILDSIRDCIQARDMMVERGISPGDICLLNRMDLSRWSDREAALGNCFSKRIVIASNIVEQGHNPPRDFMNFIISRGYYGHNLRQRAGRVGRGIRERSRLIIAMGDQAIIDRAMGKIADGMNVVERLSQEIGEEGTSLKPEIVGIYAGVLLQFFTRDARDTLVEESVSASDSRFGTGVRRSLAAVAKINEMRKKAEVEECEELSCFCSWFSDYMDTFRYFIGDREEINFMMGDSRDGASEQYRYDALWLMQNADYLKTEHGIVVTGLKDKPDRGFDVRITGLPYTDVSTREVSMTFQEIYGKERREMLDSLERAFRFLNACGGLPTQAKDLVKAIVNVTGYPERLSYRVQLGS